MAADPGADAAILHVDLDAFYASVEVLLDPALAGKPVIVGGLGNRGVVSAASYEARAYGVHSAMPMARARRACPHAVFLPPRFEHYETKSREVMTILRSITPLVEQLSIDEAFLDVKGVRRHLGTGREIAAHIRERVYDETRLAISVGVATTKFLAKVVSDMAKPNGMLVVEPGAELDFLRPLPVSKLWGVGPATLAKLERVGAHTVGDVAALPESTLVSAVGNASGRHLHALAHNRDDRRVTPTRVTKSIGAEETFPRDLHERSELHREIVRLADKVGARLRQGNHVARTFTLKVRFGDFSTITRSRTLPEATATSTLIAGVARELLASIDVSGGLRLLGVSASQLTEPQPAQGVFDLDGISEGDGDDRRAAVERAVDAIRERFGDRALRAATLVNMNEEQR
ncbi:MAG: nucleotidyltransferase/DNA polymerase involved in repair [Actinomycetia bacterium]|nr:nucleotidyltransferase/DNA polymerase involved in repair [Actinomycetes bacterium]